MTISITTSSIRLSVVYAECHVFDIIMLTVVMLTVIILTVIMLTVIMLTVIMLTVVIVTVIILTVNMLTVIMLTVVIVTVIMLTVIMLTVVVPEQGVLTDKELKIQYRIEQNIFIHYKIKLIEGSSEILTTSIIKL